MEKEFRKARQTYQDTIKKTVEPEVESAVETISQYQLLNKKTLEFANYADLLKAKSPKTFNISTFSSRAAQYAAMNSDVTERNPYVKGVRHIMKMPELQYKEVEVFKGGTLKDAVNYMQDLKSAQSIRTTNENTSMHDLSDDEQRKLTREHINRIKNHTPLEIINDLNEKILNAHNEGGR